MILLKKNDLLLSMLCRFSFSGNCDAVFMILWWKDNVDKQHLFEIEIICYIINVYTVTFDQFSASMLI